MAAILAFISESMALIKASPDLIRLAMLLVNAYQNSKQEYAIDKELHEDAKDIHADLIANDNAKLRQLFNS